MDPGAALALIAHAGDHGHSDPTALAAIAIAAMVIPLLVLGVIGRIFWRAYKRDADRES